MFLLNSNGTGIKITDGGPDGTVLDYVIVGILDFHFFAGNKDDPGEVAVRRGGGFARWSFVLVF